MHHLIRCFVTLIGIIGCSYAQVRVRMVVKSTFPVNKNESIYVAGNFNNWNPANGGYQLQLLSNGQWNTALTTAPNSLLEFKFTRGSWATVACAADGKDLSNYAIKVLSDTTLYFTVDSWQDAHGSMGKKHTASPQVQLLDSAFNLMALGRNRRIWIYLPKDYNSSKKRYPVLYMHDGQNLFDEATAGFGEWGVDELLDQYFEATHKSCIVIGIDNGRNRITEYDPYDTEKYGKGEGVQYIQSIVESLKPFIDKQYRTLPNAANTWIAGSSLGGIISQWAVMAYPKVFGKAGIFSPAFWIAPQFNSDVPKMMKGYKGELYYYCGEKESNTMVPYMDSIMTKVKAVSKAVLVRSVAAEGQHNEQSWHRSFAAFLKLVFE